jgi:hypothetical protein
MGFPGMSDAQIIADWPVQASPTTPSSKKAFSAHSGATGAEPYRLEKQQCQATTTLSPTCATSTAPSNSCQEAELLDGFKLLEWLLLLDRDIDYRIAIRSTRPQDELDKSFSATTFHMIEHFGSLEARMKRFGGGGWSEFRRHARAATCRTSASIAAPKTG